MQSVVRRVAENTILIIAGNLISIAVGLATNILIVRYLGARSFGVYSAIFAYLTFFSLITDLGIGTIVVREASKDRGRAGILIGNAIMMKLVLSLVAIASSSVVVYLLHYPPEVKIFTYIASLSFLFSFASLYRIIFQLELKMRYPVLADMANVAVKFILAAYLVFIRGPLFWFIVIEVASNLPGIFIVWWLSRAHLRPVMRFDPAAWGLIIRESWPLAASGIFVIIYSRADVMLLAFIKGAASVGYYSAAYKLTESLAILPSAFMMSVFPLMSHYFKHSPDSLIRSYRLSFKYLLVMILPVAAATTVLAAQVIKVLYGAKYLPSVPALALLVWAEVFVFANIVMHNMIISVGKQKVATINTVLMASTNIALNLILIPGYGFVGASIAMVATQGLGCALGAAWLNSFGYRLPLLNAVLKPVAGVACVALVLLAMPARQFFISLPLAFICYALVAVLAGALTKEDLALAKSCFYGADDRVRKII